MKVAVLGLLSVAVLAGCASAPRGSIPVVDSTSSASELEQDYANTGWQSAPSASPQAAPADEAVMVMVPQGVSSAPIQVLSQEQAPSITYMEPVQSVPSAPTGIPVGSLAADEQLDGPVLALLTTAKQMQEGGDLNGAASSLERAQRIAPREPQVLYRLAELRLAQGDAAQAEQLARRGLSYAAGRPSLQAGLWELVAQSRERQGDAAGAAQARQNARVNL